MGAAHLRFVDLGQGFSEGDDGAVLLGHSHPSIPRWISSQNTRLARSVSL